MILVMSMNMAIVMMLVVILMVIMISDTDSNNGDRATLDTFQKITLINVIIKNKW